MAHESSCAVFDPGRHACDCGEIMRITRTEYLDLLAQLSALQSDSKDAERYRTVRRFVGAKRCRFMDSEPHQFHLESLPAVKGANLFKGSVAQHFDEAIDAARQALSTPAQEQTHD
jgi:hypothetical protein